MNRIVTSIALACAFTFGSTASAAIAVGPTIGGFATFTDSLTGRNWARLDIFFGKTHNEMASAVTAAGFTVAVQSEVATLLATLPLGAGEWAGYRPVMGASPNDVLIWGSFGPVDATNLVGWAFSFNNSTEWVFNLAVVDADTTSTDFEVMNIWAYAKGAPGIPEPATWAMLIAGFGLVGVAMRRRAAHLA